MAPRKSRREQHPKVEKSITDFMTSPQKNVGNAKSEALENPKKRMKRSATETVDDDIDSPPNTPSIEMKVPGKVKEEEENVASRKKIGTNKSASSDGPADYSVIDARSHSIGAHVSIAGGVHNALIEARSIGASACAFFLRPPKAFTVKPLDEDTVAKWQDAVKATQFNLNNIVVHAPYLLNIGSPKDEALERSRLVLFDDLQRCDRLGIKYYNVHPGSTLGEIPVDKCCKAIAESVNMGLKKTKNVVLLLENMAGQGNWVGSKLSELGTIISLIEDKERVGVCLDTCHAFAYGYGLNTASGLKRLLDDFRKHVGMQYLKAIHLNDSKGACGDNRDRHEDIGKGVIGKAGFKLFMNEPVFRGIPLILETPGGIYDREIELLHSFVNNSKDEKKS